MTTLQKKTHVQDSVYSQNQIEVGTHDTVEDQDSFSYRSPEKKIEKASIHHQDGNSSVPTTAFNIINTAIGGGILGYPYIMRQLGVISGILMVIIGGILTCYSVTILQKVKNLAHRCAYMEIAEVCFKRVGHILAAVTIVFNTLGGCIIYLVVFTTVVQNILEAFVEDCVPSGDPIKFYCRTSLISIFGALLILPFNFMKDFAKLRVIGLMKVTSILIFTGVTIAFAIYKAARGETASDVALGPNFEEPVALLATIPQIFFGFNFLYNQFALYKGMKDATDKKFNKTAIASLSFVGLVYIGVGICGYLIYGSQTDNMLKNFSREDLGSVWFCVLNIAFLVCSLGGIPVTFFPAREIFYDSISKRLAKRRNHDDYTKVADERSVSLNESQSVDAEPKKNKKVFVAIVLVTNVLIVLIAIVAPGLNQVLGVIGSIGSSGLMFLFPMSFYLLLSHKKGRGRALPIAVFVFGVLIAISGFITNLMKIFS